MSTPPRPVELPPSSPAIEGMPPVVVAELPPWSAVERELGVSDDVVTFVGRDLVTGRPRIKVELSSVDASPEWGEWILEWLERRRYGALQLVERVR